MLKNEIVLGLFGSTALAFTAVSLLRAYAPNLTPTFGLNAHSEKITYAIPRKIGYRRALAFQERLERR